MPLSRNSLSFPDCEAIFERANESPKGVRLPCSDSGAAHRLRLRLNHYRALLREDSQRVYEPDHPLYGRSAFDHFICSVRDEAGVSYIYVRSAKSEAGLVNIEEIPDDTPASPELETELEEAEPTPTPRVASSFRRV